MTTADQLKAEAQEADHTFEFRGATYTLPANFNEADGDVLEHYENERPISALKALLGEEQFAKYKAKEKPRVKDHFEFITAAFKAMGTSPGE